MSQSKTDRLRLIMAEHRLKGPDVARLTGRKLNTVHIWMSHRGQDIPDDALELLEMRTNKCGSE